MDEIVVDDPHRLFDDWMAEAQAAELNDANAMTVATVSADGRPSSRILLLKGHDQEGFVFYTNLDSRKGEEIKGNRFAALLFHWKSLRRQIRIEGPLSPVSSTEADAYFHSRARMSRIGAWASDQSRPLADRKLLEARVAEMERRFKDVEPPRPENWTGFRMTPERIEFWRDGAFRLHDRVVYTPDRGQWRTERLYP
ncbi:MAG: pyridoxamine 5'-phosphate oxidase [Alphaproteobacteria bacterium]